MFLKAEFPGFLGSEDAPTTATLFGLKNAPSADMSCIIFPLSLAALAALYELPQLYRFHRARDQRKITKTRSETAARDVTAAWAQFSPAWPGTDANLCSRERIITFRVDARA